MHLPQHCLHATACPSQTGELHLSRLALRVQVVVTLDNNDTGFVGLNHQGATCYMNSLLQTLYNINCFRQVSTLAHLPSEGHHLVKGPIFA